MKLRKYFLIILIGSSQFIAGQNLGFPLDPCPPHSNEPNRDCHEIWQGSGDGESINGLKQGYWHESFSEMPYAEGSYVNGKKEGLWKFYLIKANKIFDSKKLADKKSFKNAKTYCTANFKDGKLSGEYIRFNKKNIYMTANYNDDTLVGLLKMYDEKKRLIYIGDFDNLYFDTACFETGTKLSLEEKLFCKLPMSQYFEFSGKTDWFEFKGYMKFKEDVFSQNYYLVYVKREKKFVIKYLDPSFYKDDMAEGIYKMVEKNELLSEFEIKNGKKTIVKHFEVK